MGTLWRMLQQSTANVHSLLNTLPAIPWDAPEPLPVMRREMKLLLIELNLVRTEVQQLRVAKQEADKTRESLTASVGRLIESQDHWQREAERFSELMAQVPPWTLFWWRCLDAFKACRNAYR